MKTCVFITGTNGVGKTTLAKGLIKHFGGIKQASKTITRCEDERVCFAGKYSAESKFGGVDSFGSTRWLADVVKEGLATSDVIVCEGSYLDTIGMNLTNAAFVADKQLVVFLFCEGSTLKERLQNRSHGQVCKEIIARHNRCVRASQKWAEIGVPVLAIDTSSAGTENVTKQVIDKLEKMGAI